MDKLERILSLQKKSILVCVHKRETEIENVWIYSHKTHVQKQTYEKAVTQSLDKCPPLFIQVGIN